MSLIKKIENTLLKSRAINFLEVYFYKLLFIIFYLLPVNKKKITFLNFHFKEMYGNNKAVYEEIKKQNLNYKICHINKSDIDYIYRISLAKFFVKIKIAYLMNTSSFLFLNDNYSLLRYIKIKKGIEVIQLWHGTGAFKKFGLCSEHMSKKQIDNYKKATSNYTKVIVSSNTIVDIYANCFGVSEEKILPLGSPKSDDYFNLNLVKEYRKQVLENLSKLNISKEKLNILYAPTFRDADRSKALHLDTSKLKKEFGNTHNLLIKMHPIYKGEIQISVEDVGFVFNVSNLNIDDLLFATDILITDYSSVIFEYAILNKPMIFYAYDYDEYIDKSRAFFEDYKGFVPGPIATTTAEVIDLIQKNSWNLNQQKDFVNKYITNQGKAAQALVNKLLK